ncbi:MAG: PilW family protein [Pseudomonadota bacterium]
MKPISAHKLATRSAAGLSLIELMVALAIGSFLVLGVTTVFLANRDSATLENSLARLQENGRFALDLIRDDMHEAQFLGCNTGDVFVVNMTEDPNAAGAGVSTIEGVRGYERNGTGVWGAVPDSTVLSAGILAADTAGGARNGSDVLRIRTTELMNEDDPNDPLLTATVLPSSTAVAIDDNPGCEIEQNSQVIVTGCELSAHVFEVANAQTCTAATPPNPTTLSFDDTALNPTNRINTTYGLDAQVLLFEDAVWFVADTGRERNGFDVWALYREVGGTSQEMIEGVEHMQVKFGQRVPGTTSIRYVDPSDADLNAGLNAEGIISVRVALLMQSFEAVKNAADARIYLLTDEQVGDSSAPGAQGGFHAGGVAQRDVFSTTVMLRNAPEV